MPFCGWDVQKVTSLMQARWELAAAMMRHGGPWVGGLGGMLHILKTHINVWHYVFAFVVLAKNVLLRNMF